jgi:hypothetical protein
VYWTVDPRRCTDPGTWQRLFIELVDDDMRTVIVDVRSVVDFLSSRISLLRLLGGGSQIVIVGVRSAVAFVSSTYILQTFLCTSPAISPRRLTGDSLRRTCILSE